MSKEDKTCSCRALSVKCAGKCFGASFSGVGNALSATEKILDKIVSGVTNTIVTTGDWVNAGLINSAVSLTILFAATDSTKIAAEWIYSVLTVVILVVMAVLPYRIRHKKDLANEIEVAMSEKQILAHGVFDVPKEEREEQKGVLSKVGSQVKILRAKQIKLLYETVAVVAVLSHRRAAQASFWQLRSSSQRLGGVFLYFLLVWTVSLTVLSKQATRMERVLQETAAILEEKGWEPMSAELTRYAQQKRLMIVLKMSFALGMGWALRDWMTAFNNAVWYTDQIPGLSPRGSFLALQWIFTISGTFFVAGVRLVHEKYYLLYPATDEVHLFPLGSERRRIAGEVLFSSINFWQQLLWYGSILASVRLVDEHPMASAWCLAFGLVLAGILIQSIFAWILEHIKIIRKLKIARKKQKSDAETMRSDSLFLASAFLSPDDVEDDQVKYSCKESYCIHFFPAISDALTVSGALHVYVAVDTTIQINLNRFNLSQQPSVFEQQHVKPVWQQVLVQWLVAIIMMPLTAFVVTYLAQVMTAALEAKRNLKNTIVTSISGRSSTTGLFAAEFKRDQPETGDVDGDGGVALELAG